MANTYVFDSDSDLGHQHVEYLSLLLDEHSFAGLDSIGVEPGQRCLDLGAGGGSITRGLAERVGPAGQVVAVDIATDYLSSLTDLPNVEIHRHDIHDGIPASGTFDLIHARLVLMHLPHRLEILDTLVDALTPGGWLVLTEFVGPQQQRVVSVPNEGDEEFFLRVQKTAHAFPARAAGVSYEWAYEAAPAMAAAGLTNVRSDSFSHSAAGGEPAWQLMRVLYGQLWNVFVANDVLTEAELQRFDGLICDPRFNAWFYTGVTTRGQRPIG